MDVFGKLKTERVEGVGKTAESILLFPVQHPTLTALMLGGIFTLITYPGIWYSDSYARAMIASQISDGVDYSEVSTFLSLLPQLFISWGLKLTGNFAFYTWVQASFFLGTLIYVIRFFFSDYKSIQAVVLLLFLCCPLVFGYSVYWETGVVTATALVLLVAISEKQCREKTMPQGIMWIILGGCFVCVGYRINAATAIFAILLIEIWDGIHGRKPMHRVLLAGSAILLGMLLAISLPRLLKTKNNSNVVVGIVWETSCMLNRIGKGQGYDTYVDDLLGEGTTNAIMEVENLPEESMYLFDGITNYWSIPNDRWLTGQYFRKYFHLVSEKPRTFLRMKIEMAKRTLGELPFLEYDYNRYDRMSEFQYSDSQRRHDFYDTVVKFMENWHWGRTPWKVFLTSFILLGICVLGKANGIVAGKLSFVALFYEMAFLVTTQSHEFRYFFPALFLLIIAITIEIFEISKRAAQIFKARLQQETIHDLR